MTTLPTQATLTLMNSSKNAIYLKIPAMLIILLSGIVSTACDDKQKGEYRVNATIMPDNDTSEKKKEADE